MPLNTPDLEALGWNAFFERAFAGPRERGLRPGRVATEDKHYYMLLSADGELTGQVSGRLLHFAKGAAELPKVGDWVAYSPVSGEAKAVIQDVLPRRTRLSRKVSGCEFEEQVLAANIDLGFIVQALDRTFNPALLQRHLVMVLEGGARPVVVLNKADLCDSIPEHTAEASRVAGDVPVLVASAKTTRGVPELAERIRPGETVVFIGSSGVGKSTLINDLCGEEVQPTAEVRDWDSKGRHTTSWRELIRLPHGGWVIDTPGMREFHLWEATEGMREAFADLEELGGRCHFRDCTHTVEKRCAVLEAVGAGSLSAERYRRFLKLRAELAHLEEAQNRRARMRKRRQARIAQSAFDRLKRQR